MSATPLKARRRFFRFGRRVLLLMVLALALLPVGQGRSDEPQPADVAGQPIRWDGTVRDVHGQAVPGASVFVLATYLHHLSPFGDRPTGHLLYALSDEQGNWKTSLEIPAGAISRSMCRRATLIVYAPGRSPIYVGLSYPTDDEKKTSQGRTSTHSIALVLPSTSASLTVKAIGDWGPLAQGTIRIAHEQWPNLYLHHFAGTDDAEQRRLLEKVLRPVAIADAEGVGRFDDLAPGTYRITAAGRDDDHLRYQQADARQPQTYLAHRGVSVQAGGNQQFTGYFYQQYSAAKLRVVQADGRPASWERTVFGYRHTSQTAGGVGSGGWIGDHGETEFSFGKPGLWQMHARYTDAKVTSAHIDAPCCEAAGCVAASVLLRGGPPLVLTARWIERDDPPRAPSAGEEHKDRKNDFPKIFGRVVLANGETPAFGAELFAAAPGSRRAMAYAQADALGNFHAYRPAHGQAPLLDLGRPGGPAEAVLVARLPGECGAALVPFASLDPALPCTIKLPPAVELRGQVSVGGKSALAWRNEIRVLAAHTGAGPLDALMDVETSAEADGSFRLSGLTPGDYQIQAALDGIWLSPSVALTVAADGAQPAPIKLDIGEPGVRSEIHCVDAAGKPQIGIEASLDRPSGPLSERLWPKSFVSDGAGVIHLPPLETGRHVLHVQGTVKAEELTIGSIKAADHLPLEVRVVAD